MITKLKVEMKVINHISQADAYTELLIPERATILKESKILAKQIQGEIPNVSLEELAFEISVRLPNPPLREFFFLAHA
jgi:hypothetical protein